MQALGFFLKVCEFGRGPSFETAVLKAPGFRACGGAFLSGGTPGATVGDSTEEARDLRTEAAMLCK